MSSFAKQTICPSSATLSAYCGGTLSFLARASVAEHLAVCEFCGAESSLLAQHAPPVETLDAQVAPQMPLALRLLAESIFGEMHAAAAEAAGRRAA